MIPLYCATNRSIRQEKLYLFFSFFKDSLRRQDERARIRVVPAPFLTKHCGQRWQENLDTPRLCLNDLLNAPFPAKLGAVTVKQNADSPRDLQNSRLRRVSEIQQNQQIHIDDRHGVPPCALW